MNNNFQRSDITKKIHWLDFEEQAVMGESVCRIEEHYEGPEHAGKIFTIEEYMPWYMANTNKNEFTYYTDWHGYNFPARILYPFRVGQFDPLSTLEINLLDSLSDVELDHYIITTFCGEAGALKHEVAHALFSTEPKYVQQILRILCTVPLTPIFETIEVHGYAGVTWVDEAHAYLTECPFLLRTWGCDVNPYLEIIEELQNIHNQWSPLEETKYLDPWIDHDTRTQAKIVTV